MESVRPLISVCVPTYNQESEIRQALNGILSQKNVNIEIIIANDGSTDRTHDVCMEYLNKYPSVIKYINQKYNKGIIKNTEDCLMAASGKYIAICEGDDYWIDDYKLRNQCALMESDEQISMSHTNWVNLYQETNTFEIEKIKEASYICEIEGGIKSFEEIYQSKYRGIRFSSTVFRSDIFHKIVNYHPDFFSSSFSTIDLGLFLCMAYYGRIAYINAATTVYRIHDGSVSINSNLTIQNKFALGMLHILCYFADQFHYSHKEMNRRINKPFGGILNHAIKNNDSLAIQELWNIKTTYKPKLTPQRLVIMCLAKNCILRKLIKNVL